MVESLVFIEIASPRSACSSESEIMVHFIAVPLSRHSPAIFPRAAARPGSFVLRCTCNLRLRIHRSCGNGAKRRKRSGGLESGSAGAFDMVDVLKELL